MANVKEIISFMRDGTTKEGEGLIEKAYTFAQKAHDGQKRLDGSPYFSHVFETAKILAQIGMDAETVAAGLLHDVLEDTKITEEEMKKEFGDRIIFLVNGVTKLGTLKYRGSERHVESLRKFFIAMTDDLRVVIIKFADRLHNLRTLEHVREDKRKRIAMESIEVYAPLADRLGMGRLKSELEDAAFPFAYPKEYKETEELLRNEKKTFEKNLAEVKNELEKELVKNKVNIVDIDYRVKHKYSLWRKLLRKDKDLSKVYDIVALRVVVETIEECYQVLGIVHSLWKPLPGRIKDYIALPKPNGYRSIHTTIFTGKRGIAEIQIRTREMNLEAAYGFAAHFAYKETASRKKKTDDISQLKWLEELKNLHHEHDFSDPQKYLEHLKMDFFSDRIFIFTPKSDIIDLPEDSSPVDFAYAIHSDVGEHISGVKINGRIASIDTKLKNGDIVEIITKKDARPSSKWLDYAKTSMAKKHIKSYLEKNSLLARLKSFGRS